MKKLKFFAGLDILVLSFSGCSVAKVSKLPSKKSMDLIQVGQHRAVIVAEFGEPVEVEEKDGKIVEINAFDKGHSAGGKLLRGFTYGAAGVYTLGISGVVANPLESSISDQDKAVMQVTYSQDKTLEGVVMLSEGS